MRFGVEHSTAQSSAFVTISKTGSRGSVRPWRER